MGLLEDILERLQRVEADNIVLKQEVELTAMLYDELVWIPSSRVLGWKIQGISSWKGIHSAGLVVNMETRPAGISANSLKDYLRKKGYTIEAIKERMAA